MKRFFLLVVLTLAGLRPASAQDWGRVSGTITEDETRVSIPNVTVLLDGTNFGTASDERGAYSFRVPVGSWILRFSAIGFETRHDTIRIHTDQTLRHDVVLRPSTTQAEPLVVEGERPAAGAIEIDPRTIQDIPAPFRDGFRILKVQPGVATNNELSSEYSVRGGGFNENLVFIDGFEVYKPFRVRQGEQEGLGLVNPDLTERMTFYTGAFPARYGGKLSSALDVQYGNRSDAAMSGSGYVSLLDAGTALNGRLADGISGSVGIRAARGEHLFESQELKGSYDPQYTDLQARVDARLSRGHTLKAVAMWADHSFRLEPNTRKTFFGTFDNLQSIWFNYQGSEHDGYGTRFGGLRHAGALSPAITVEHGLSIFDTEETETFDISGSAVLYIIDNPVESDPEGGDGLIPTGAATQNDFADNAISVRNVTGQQRWLVDVGSGALDLGWYVRDISFEDRIDERSIVVGRNLEGDIVRLVADSLTDGAAFDATQAGGYAEHSFRAGPSSPVQITVGLRGDYLSFNDELTVSPRLSAVYAVQPGLTLNGAWGIYYQAPGYREFRGTPLAGGSVEAAINSNLRSQRSIQWIGGIEYFMASRRVFLRGETYYKLLNDLISYEVQNVRIVYSGNNDSDGHAYGLDLQVRGEFVPGLESWLNYGFLVTRERFYEEYLTPYNRGSVPRPTDQRHTFSLFVQDYVPNEPSWKIHMRILYGTGMPYTPPVPGPSVGNVQTQLPGPRNSDRYPAYQRLDIGATKTISLRPSTGRWNPVDLQLTAELLNLFDSINTVAYTWVARADGIWSRIPTHLTPRTFNVRARVVF
ncbi:MAG TPA: TonB-dependent receptor [Rhodothermia bacterium]|nr:TonB-dependent receptor [Rhodothermia bacterium]